MKLFYRLPRLIHSLPRDLKFRLTFLFLFFVSTWLFAQTEEVSVLPQYFAADPLIKRDPVFEKMHEALNRSMEETGLGLSENLTQKLNEIERYVSNFSITVTPVPGQAASGPSPAIPNKIKFDYTFFGESQTATISKDSLDAMATEMSKFFARNALEKFSLEETLSGTMQDFNKLILFILINAIETAPSDINEFSSVTGDKFRSDFGADMLQFMKSASNFDWNSSPAFEYNVAILQTKMSALIENMKGRIIEKKYEFEDIIKKVKKDISGGMVSANAGLGVNQAEGNLGGGIIVSFRRDRTDGSPKFNAAIFVSGVGELGSKDSSALRQPFLFGFTLQQKITDNFQVAGIVSGKYNEERLEDNHWLLEAGGGILHRTRANMIIGVSFYCLFIDKTIQTAEGIIPVEREIKSIYTVGMTLRGNASASPTVLIGASNQSRWTPVIQISYPINFSQQ